jgi:hypothetical protein
MPIGSPLRCAFGAQPPAVRLTPLKLSATASWWFEGAQNNAPRTTRKVLPLAAGNADHAVKSVNDGSAAESMIHLTQDPLSLCKSRKSAICDKAAGELGRWALEAPH